MKFIKVFIAPLAFVVCILGIVFGESRQSLIKANAMPNVILVVVDSLRSAHVSSYGYSRSTTPELDKWLANEGTVLSNATAPSPWTYPSNAGMLTGKQSANLGVTWSQWQNADNTISDSEIFLAEYLKNENYATAGFVTAYFMSARFGFDQGFDYFGENTRNNADKVWADELNSSAMNWLSNEWDDSQPLFLLLYYYDPHSWYNPPAPYDILYDSTYTGTLTADVYQNGRSVVEGDIVPTERDVEHIIALYDGSITYWDHYFGEMMTFLGQKGILDNSIVILTADHGEMFGEHGKWAHHNSLYEEVLRVPFIVRYDGVVPANAVIDAPVSTIDIPPTVLGLLGMSATGFEGVSLAEGLRGETVLPIDRPIFSDADAIIDPNIPPYWQAPHSELRAVRQGDWKYIYGFDDTTQELYQLQPDSIYEVDDLFSSHPDQAHTMYTYLDSRFFLPTNYLYLPCSQR